MNSKESNGSLKFFKSIKVQSYINSYSLIIIHYLISENDKSVPLIVCDFHSKRGKKNTLSLVKLSEILRVVGLLGKKFTFFNSLGTTKIPGVSNFVCILMFAFW